MQCSNAVLLIKPSNFIFNTETSVNNAFQNDIKINFDVIKLNVFNEFDNFKNKLIANGIEVLVIDDTEHPIKPDAIFPNNWISFHADGTIILYPMFAKNRRTERRLDIIETIKKNYYVNKIIDISFYENENKFLEGTGSIVFDHVNKIAYACLSPRTTKEVFLELCDMLNYSPISFTANDLNGQAIYHTNVMMCIAQNLAIVCTSSIVDKNEKELVLQSLEATNHIVIDISIEQMNHFAGNMLSLKSNDEKHILALSYSSFDILNKNQKEIIEKFFIMLPLNINTIEAIGGGSVRCMIAENFLPKKEL